MRWRKSGKSPSFLSGREFGSDEDRLKQKTSFVRRILVVDGVLDGLPGALDSCTDVVDGIIDSPTGTLDRTI